MREEKEGKQLCVEIEEWNIVIFLLQKSSLSILSNLVLQDCYLLDEYEKKPHFDVQWLTVWNLDGYIYSKLNAMLYSVQLGFIMLLTYGSRTFSGVDQ